MGDRVAHAAARAASPAEDRRTARAPVLEVQDLRTEILTRTGTLRAVDGVSFTLHAGETLGIVGESGSGKSMTALSIMGLVPAPAARIVAGRVVLNGVDLLQATPRAMQQIRGRQIAMILQDPMTSLNPVFTVGNQILETVRLAGKDTPRAWRARAVDLLRRVRIPSPEERMSNYPHQMSGGMRQRVAGAIALAGSPKVLIADESTTSLDATIQYQYLRLLKDLQAETGLAIIFVTHDFGIVAMMCDRVLVMYAGKVVESASVRDLFDRPSHPYTEALMRSVPNVGDQVDVLYSIEGQAPALDNLPKGCAFAPRCKYAMDRCREAAPPMISVDKAHSAACWRLP